MVLDVLSCVKSGLATYAKVIVESSCNELRMTFQRMRDADEKFQYDLWQIAQKKGYYTGSPLASAEDINMVKTGLTKGVALNQNVGAVYMSS